MGLLSASVKKHAFAEVDRFAFASQHQRRRGGIVVSWVAVGGGSAGLDHQSVPVGMGLSILGVASLMVIDLN